MHCAHRNVYDGLWNYVAIYFTPTAVLLTLKMGKMASWFNLFIQSAFVYLLTFEYYQIFNPNSLTEYVTKWPFYKQVNLRLPRKLQNEG